MNKFGFVRSQLKECNTCIDTFDNDPRPTLNKFEAIDKAILLKESLHFKHLINKF